MIQVVAIHADVSGDLVRPPGMPKSECPGRVFDIFPSGIPSSDPSYVPDDAQPNEGRIGDKVIVRLMRCAACGETLVIARGVDGKERLRNSYAPKTKNFDVFLTVSSTR